MRCELAQMLRCALGTTTVVKERISQGNNEMQAVFGLSKAPLKADIPPSLRRRCHFGRRWAAPRMANPAMTCNPLFIHHQHQLQTGQRLLMMQCNVMDLPSLWVPSSLFHGVSFSPATLVFPTVPKWYIKSVPLVRNNRFTL